MATKTTTQAGNVLVGATWGGVAPATTDDAVIAHDCTLADGETFAVKSLQISADSATGTLTCAGTSIINVLNGHLILEGSAYENITRTGASLTINVTNGDIKIGPISGVDGGFIGATGATGGNTTINMVNGNINASNGQAGNNMLKTPTGTFIVNLDATSNVIMGAGLGPCHCGAAGGSMTVNAPAGISSVPGALVNVTNGTFTFNGNVVTSTASSGLSLLGGSGSGIVNVNGNITSGDTHATGKVFNAAGTSTVTLTVTGNIATANGIVINFGSSNNGTATVTGTITAGGTGGVAITNTGAGTPTITVGGLISVTGSGGKVFNITSGVPVLHTNGGIAIAAGATLGTIPASVAIRIPAASGVSTLETAYGLNGGVTGTVNIANLEAAAAAAQLAADFANQTQLTAAQIKDGITGNWIDASGNQTSVTGDGSIEAAAAAAQLATDVGAVNARKSSIISPAEGGEVILTVEGTATAASIAGRVVTFAPPVSENGTLLTITAGNDYDVASGQPLEWTDVSGDWPVLTGASISLVIRRKKADGTGDATALLTKAGTVVTATGDTKLVRVELADTDTDDLTAGNRVNLFYLEATLATGQVVTLARGRNTVLDAGTRSEA